MSLCITAKCITERASALISSLTSVAKLGVHINVAF